MIKFYWQSISHCAVSWGGYLLASLRERLSAIPVAPSRIVVIQLGHLGDMVLTRPLVQAIKEAHPNAEINLIVLPYSQRAAQALLPEVSQIIPYNARKYARGGGQPSAVPELRNYDLVFYVRGDLALLLKSFWNLKTGFISCLAGRNKLRWSFLYHLGFPVSYSSQHQYEIFKQSALRAGAKLPDYPEIRDIGELSKDNQAKIGNGREGYAVIHPGAPWPYRRWPAEKFAEVCTSIHHDFGLKMVVIGGEESRPLLTLLGARSIPHVHLGDNLELRQLTSVLKSCRVYLGNDSGPAHLAAACGSPVVAVYGPETPAVFGVLGKRVFNIYKEANCSPCWQISCCCAGKCLHSINVVDVSQKVREILA